MWITHTTYIIYIKGNERKKFNFIDWLLQYIFYVTLCVLKNYYKIIIMRRKLNVIHKLIQNGLKMN